ELTQIGPAIDAGVVLVVEYDAYGIVADRLDLDDLHMTTAGDDLLLARPMALHFGRGAFDAQVFGWQCVRTAVGEFDLQSRFFLEDAQLGRPGCGARLVMALVRHRFR